MDSKKKEAVINPNDEVKLDDKAAEMLRDFIDNSDNASESEKEVCLRVGIVGGGCAGFQYKLALDTPSNSDLSFSSNDETIIVDKDSFEYIRGAVVTYTDGLNGVGFEVLNPRAKSSCGCGNSFTMDDEGCDQVVY